MVSTLDITLEDIVNRDFETKFTLIVSESQPALLTTDLVKLILENNNKKTLHFLSFIFPQSNQFNFQKLGADNVKIYSDFNYDLTSTDFEKVAFEGVIEESTNDILIIDDLSMLSIYFNYNSEVGKRMTKFLNFISKRFAKIICFAQLETLSQKLLSILYDYSDTIAILFNNSIENQPRNEFSCNILRIKPSCKVKMHQSFFSLENSIINTRKIDKKSKETSTQNNPDEIFKNLTTFKLTLEENEKESKSKLYLPYFEAQKKEHEQAIDFDVFDDEEEDEED